MTLQEKIGQMNQLSPFGGLEEMAGLIREGNVGSLLNLTDPELVNKAQRIAVEESRLGIPLLMSRDVIHGYKTIFPIPLGQAATFNPQLVEDGARVAAVEASADGIRWTFAPMIDISRDPRWGRIAESCGEDPYLSSVMGVAMVKGFQGDSLNNPTAVAACAKHFVGYGASEGGRDYNSTFIPERQLRNVYFPPFEAAAKAGCATFMTSFNDNDGIPSTGEQFHPERCAARRMELRRTGGNRLGILGRNDFPRFLQRRERGSHEVRECRHRHGNGKRHVYP